MKLRKSRWSKVYESSEEELTGFLAARSIVAERWELEAFAVTNGRTLDIDTTIWCVEGAANFNVNDSGISFQPGDAVQLPAGTSLQVTAGMFGCVCYEHTGQ